MNATPQGCQPGTERAAFIRAYPHLDLTEVSDAWGRPSFKHSHVQALWDGWFARAAAVGSERVEELEAFIIKLAREESALKSRVEDLTKALENAKGYVDRGIATYVGDPADNQFQKGYLAALEVVRDEAFSTTSSVPLERSRGAT